MRPKARLRMLPEVSLYSEQLPFDMKKKKTSPAKKDRMPGGFHRSSRHDNIITLAAILLHVQHFHSQAAKKECFHRGMKQ